MQGKGENIQDLKIQENMSDNVKKRERNESDQYQELMQGTPVGKK